MKSEIHKLLYRLAEIMLQQEQHVLPVDMLFDDAQIGEFVKSIQIDSPYQQLLLEGVLTESVREEKLYVSFTVEGYFHYVLGEVIFHQTEGLGAEVLKQIVETNKLNGKKEGVEECLIRDVEKDDLLRLMWLIDQGGKTLDICTYPLAHAFSIIEDHPKSDEEKEEASKKQIGRVINELLADASENDTQALEIAIKRLESLQLNAKIRIIYCSINSLIEPKPLNNAKLYVKSIKYIPEAERKAKLDLLAKLEIIKDNQQVSGFYFTLGEQYAFIAEYEKALHYYKNSIELLKSKHDDFTKAKVLQEMGNIYYRQNKLSKSLEYLKRAEKIYSRLFTKESVYVGEIYCLQSLVFQDKNKFKRAIGLIQKALNIQVKIYGKSHKEIGILYSNLSRLLSKDDNKILVAKDFAEKALDIWLKLDNNDPELCEIYNNLGVISAQIGDYEKAINYYEQTINLARLNFGNHHTKTATFLYNLSCSYIDMSKFYNALDACHESAKIFNKIFDKNHPLALSSKKQYAFILNKLGQIEKENKEYKSSIKYFQKSAKIRLKVLGNLNPQTAESHYNVASVSAITGDVKKANEFYNKALTIFLNALGKNHEVVGIVEERIKQLNDS
jgi:tetratricopeptide (TPR) repeat protein